MRAIGNFARERLPCLDRSREVALLLSNIAQIEVRGSRVRIDIDRLGKRATGCSRIAVAALRRADLVGQERENLLIFGMASAVHARDFAADPQRVGPLLLLFVQLLQVHQRVSIFRIESHYFLEGFERAVDKPSVAEIQRQARLHVGLFELGEIGTL